MKHRDGMCTNLLPNLTDGSEFPKKVDWQKWEKEKIKNKHFLLPKPLHTTQKPFVCLDTNIVLGLMYVSQNKDSASKENGLSKSEQTIKKLQMLIEQGKITAIVTPYVLQELYFGRYKYGDDCFKYLKNNNIFVLDIPSNIDVYYFEDVENIALRYCGRCKSPYAPHARQGKRAENKIFPLAYEYKIKRPNIDARIMAEASLLGCTLLTKNSTHFLLDEKDANIARINKELRLGENLKPYKPNVFLTFWELNHQFSELKGKYKQYVVPAKEFEF